MSEPLSVAAGLAGKVMFSKLAKELYQYVAQKTGVRVKQFSVKRQITKLHKSISEIRKVKTIWQIDKAVDLTDFYCDSHVIIHNKRVKIRHLSDFGSQDYILIQGIAGQGKSIFLRYLCSMELARGEYIPLFIELRRISSSQSLKDRIFITLEGLGLKVTEDIFDALAESGKLLLLLDAFDEVPDELKTTILTEIEDLIATRPSLRVVITARPHEAIQASNHFLVVTLDYLKNDEYKNVILKLASGQKWADHLIAHIKTQAVHIGGMLCTPLMVSLLVLSYKAYQQLPARLSDFYDSLFQTLLQRHDGTKPGFARKRTTTLDDSQYRLVFETLCILTKKSGQQSLTTNSIRTLAQTALEQCSIQANPTAYIADIVKITCLILRDGEEHRFIHKTVQEYYTASYIQKKPEPWATEFYARILKNNGYASWQQELEFLSEIDQYRYKKFFLLPTILDYLNLKQSDLDRAADDVISLSSKKAFSGISISIRDDSDQKSYSIIYWGGNSLAHGTLSKILPLIHFPSVKPAFMKAAGPIGEEQSQTETAHLAQKERSILFATFFDVLNNEECRLAANQELKRLFETAKNIRKSSAIEENPSVLEGLL